MKKWIIRIIVAVLVIGAFAGAGFAGYRIGYSHGAQATDDGNKIPPFARFERGGPEVLPGFNHRFEPGFDRGFSRDGGVVMRQRGGFGFFSPFMLLARVALLGLVIWVVYILFKGNGWTLSLTRAAAPQTPPATDRIETASPAKTKKGKQ